jgi:hypothetical protein
MMIPECPRCHTQEFLPIPDSLASYCNKCGFVWVLDGKGYSAGATIGQWAEDVFGIPNTLDEPIDKSDDCQD